MNLDEFITQYEEANDIKLMPYQKEILKMYQKSIELGVPLYFNYPYRSGKRILAKALEECKKAIEP